MEQIIGWAQKQMEAARFNYNVDPVIYLALVIVCAPFFYYSIYRLVRATAKKDKSQLGLWSTMFLASTALPYIYVLIFGRNMPWYVYLLLAALIGQGVWSLVKKLKGGKKGEAAPEATVSSHEKN